MTAAITVEGLSKAYRIGLQDEIPDTLIGAATSWLKAPLKNFRNLARLNTFEGPDEEAADLHWALRDVSFEVEDGDVVAIIGHNGAGKSTLLKLLSRITQPTLGRAIIRGRVSSLLEVGTGFHPELSGRENIYMNGTILGMRKAEIDRKFDEIVEFSGVAKFLDTPIKRYSSGMKVRLAFAVAAHLEPEILVIDEVLAVGDQQFQNKCLGKMGEVANSGRTVLFVSHNMAAVQVLCPRAILLEGGRIKCMGKTEDVLPAYLSKTSHLSPEIDLTEHEGRERGRDVVATRFCIRDGAGDLSSTLQLGSDVRFDVHVKTPERFQHLRVAIRVFSSVGQRVTTLHSEYQYPQTMSIDGEAVVSATWKNCPLMPGTYSIVLQIDDGRTCHDKIETGLDFVISDADLFGTGRPLPAHSAVFVPNVEWSHSAPVSTDQA